FGARRRRPAARASLSPYTTLFRSREADARSSLVWWKEIAHQHGVHRNDAALHQTKQGRDHVERGQAVEPQVEQQRRCTPCWCARSEEHTSELQSLTTLVCRLLLAQ